MKPYYQDDQVTLYHGDCLEITEWLEADVLVTDPPYGIAWRQKFGGAQHHLKHKQEVVNNVIHGDDNTDFRDEVLRRWGTKPAIVFGSWRIPRPERTNNLLVWHKGNTSSGVANCAFFTVHEEIYALGSGWRKSAPPLLSVITTQESRRHQPGIVGHPTPKPVQLMELLVDRCQPGVIADPFAGSGSTLVAARNLGRKAIGVEIEEKYCELIAKRLDQMCLDFGGAP